MMRTRGITTFALCGLTLTSTAWSAVTLVEQGTARAVVVCAGEADRAAAEEFVSVVEDMSGAKLPVEAPGAQTGARALVGEAAKAPFKQEELTSLSYDGYRIRIRGDILAISGKTPLGTINGVHGFLQDHLGARWFMPSELFEVLPHYETIRLSDCDEVHIPSFDCRLFSGLDNEHQQKWGQRLRLSSYSWEVPFAAGFTHYLYALFPPSKFAATAPEIYPIVNLKRVMPTSDEPPPWQPCTANPRTVEIAIQEINRFFDGHSQSHTCSVSINDNDTWCECDLCQALDVPNEFRGRQTHSDRYYTFVNAVARGVAKKHPDKFIGCFAYWGVEPPPETIEKLEPNVFVDITQDTSQYHDRAYRKQDYGLWRQWQAKCRQMGKYDYSGLGALAPRYYPHLWAEDLRHSKKIGLVAMYSEAYPYWSNYGPMIYLGARMLWDVNLDEDELLAEFFDKLYGPAAKPIAAFYEELEQAWMTPRKGQWFAGISSAAQQCDIYTLERLERLEGYLREAARLAPTEVVGRRVEYIRKCFKYPALFIRGWLTAKAVSQTQDPEELKGLLDTLISIATGRDNTFRRSVTEDELSTSWYDQYAGREAVQGEWWSAVKGAILAATEALANRGGPGTLDRLIEGMNERDPDSVIAIELRARRGDFDHLPNLVTNAGFEETQTGSNPTGPDWESADAPFGWSVWRQTVGKGRFFRDMKMPHSGSCSAAMKGGECLCYITRVPVTPGKRYVGWARIRAENVKLPRKTTFEIRWNDARGAWHAVDRQAASAAFTALEWTRVTGAARAPEGAASAVLLLVAYGIKDDESVWFDDVFFAEVP